MSEFIKLLGVLNRELAKQEDLLKLLSRERVAIVHVNQEEIEAIAPEKEKLLEELRNLVNGRNDAVYRLAEKVLHKEAVQLDNVIAKCSQQDIRGQLDKSREEIKKTAIAITELNTFNGQLIRKTLGLVTSTLSILSGGSSSDIETYMASGIIRKEDETSTPMSCRSLNKEI